MSLSRRHCRGPRRPGRELSRWLRDREAAEEDFPLLREVFAYTAWRSLCALPLATRGRLGFFVAFFAEPQEFDSEARSFVETIVGLSSRRSSGPTSSPRRRSRGTGPAGCRP